MNKVSKIVISVLSIFLAFALVLSGWLYFCYESPEDLATQARAKDLSAQLDGALVTIDENTSLIETLSQKLSDLTADLEAKEESIRELEKKISTLLDEGTAADEYQQLLLDEIARMKDESIKDRDEIAKLTELIRNFENITINTVKSLCNISCQFNMLHLILSDRNKVCLIQQNVSRH